MIWSKICCGLRLRRHRDKVQPGRVPWSEGSPERGSWPGSAQVGSGLRPTQLSGITVPEAPSTLHPEGDLGAETTGPAAGAPSCALRVPGAASGPSSLSLAGFPRKRAKCILPQLSPPPQTSLCREPRFLLWRGRPQLNPRPPLPCRWLARLGSGGSGAEGPQLARGHSGASRQQWKMARPGSQNHHRTAFL